MRGRIALTRRDLESVTSELDVSPEGCHGYPILQPQYNIATASVHPILTLNERMRFISVTWGSGPQKWSPTDHQLAVGKPSA
jgi:hypothetical protein